MKLNSQGIVENQPGVSLDIFTKKIVQTSVKQTGCICYVFYRTRKAIILSTSVRQWFLTFSQMNPVHSLLFYFFQTGFNIILPCSSRWDLFHVLSFLQSFLPKLCSLHISQFSYTLHAAHPSIHYFYIVLIRRNEQERRGSSL